MTTERSVVVVGLGPGDPAAVPAANLAALAAAAKVFLRTARHPAVEAVARAGIAFETFDALYEGAATFDDVYAAIVTRLLQETRQRGRVAYAVTGHPLVGETSVSLLRRAAASEGVRVDILGAPSFVDGVLLACGLDPLEGLAVVDALAVDRLAPAAALRGPVGTLMIAQVYDQIVAGRVKLWLMEALGADAPVKVVRAAGVPGEERTVEIPLYELDRLPWIDHLTTVVVPAAGGADEAGNADAAGDADAAAVGDETGDRSFAAFVRVIRRLRGEYGCPWDREQTHASLKPYALEETYEVLEAIDQGNPAKLCEELGDLLLQIVLHAAIAEEAGDFTMEEVAREITRKMIRRHPHVFAGTQVKDSAEVLERWGRIKQDEREAQAAQAAQTAATATGRGEAEVPSALDGVPRHLPALLRSQRVQAKAKAVGFDWPDVKGPLDKVSEELAELLAAYGAKRQARIREEIGDLLFAVVNVARFMGEDAESALAATVGKFERRFRHVERRARETGRRLSGMTLAEMDVFWEESKELDRAENDRAESERDEGNSTN
jgi:tetrapyrrole methylase family protein/MazG family protein